MADVSRHIDLSQWDGAVRERVGSLQQAKLLVRRFHVSFTRLEQLTCATRLKLVDETIGEIL
jgi:hypothetical protein